MQRHATIAQRRLGTVLDITAQRETERLAGHLGGRTAWWRQVMGGGDGGGATRSSAQPHHTRPTHPRTLSWCGRPVIGFSSMSICCTPSPSSVKLLPIRRRSSTVHSVTANLAPSSPSRHGATRLITWEGEGEGGDEVEVRVEVSCEVERRCSRVGEPRRRWGGCALILLSVAPTDQPTDRPTDRAHLSPFVVRFSQPLIIASAVRLTGVAIAGPPHRNTIMQDLRYALHHPEVALIDRTSSELAVRCDAMRCDAMPCHAPRGAR